MQLIISRTMWSIALTVAVVFNASCASSKVCSLN